MKIDKSIVGSFVLLLAIASLYRIMPGRVPGFAPQIAMALFSGSIVKNKKFAFLLPLVSMLVSDIIYEILFRSGISAIALAFVPTNDCPLLRTASICKRGYSHASREILCISRSSRFSARPCRLRRLQCAFSTTSITIFCNHHSVQCQRAG